MNQICPKELYSYRAAEAFWKEGNNLGIAESVIWRAFMISTGLWAAGDKEYLYHALIASLTVETYVLYWAKTQRGFKPS